MLPAWFHPTRKGLVSAGFYQTATEERTSRHGHKAAWPSVCRWRPKKFQNSACNFFIMEYIDVSMKLQDKALNPERVWVPSAPTLPVCDCWFIDSGTWAASCVPRSHSSLRRAHRPDIRSLCRCWCLHLHLRWIFVQPGLINCSGIVYYVPWPVFCFFFPSWPESWENKRPDRVTRGGCSMWHFYYLWPLEIVVMFFCLASPRVCELCSSKWPCEICQCCTLSSFCVVSVALRVIWPCHYVLIHRGPAGET